MKSVGVIGGLGPETTAKFYLEVIFQCQTENQDQRPSIVISNVPMPFEVENDYIANRGIERCLPLLTSEAKRLESAGMDFLVMPCNTLHVFINEIRAAVHIPVISIVEETTRRIVADNFKKAGLISTSATVTNKLYDTQLEENGVEYLLPGAEAGEQTDAIIRRLFASEHLDADKMYLESVARELSDKGADCIVLACTDLQLLMPLDIAVPVLDTMKILAESTTRAILDKYNRR